MGSMDELMRLAQTSRKRKKGSQAAETAPAPRPDRPSVAVLPYDTVKSGIDTHPLVHTYRLKTRKVYNYIVRLLTFIDEDGTVRAPNKYTKGAASSSSSSAPAPAPPLPGAAQTLSPCCKKPMVTTDESVVCSACGAVRSSRIVYESHYRYFAEDKENGKGDPSHWSRVDDDERASEDLWDELDEAMPYAFHGRATRAHLDTARALVDVLKAESSGPVANRWAAVCATWIVVENPRVCTDSSVGIAVEALPAGRFVCVGCSTPFHRGVDLRMHKRRCVVT